MALGCQDLPKGCTLHMRRAWKHLALLLKNREGLANAHSQRALGTKKIAYNKMPSAVRTPRARAGRRTFTRSGAKKKRARNLWYGYPRHAPSGKTQINSRYQNANAVVAPSMPRTRARRRTFTHSGKKKATKAYGIVVRRLFCSKHFRSCTPRRCVR